MALYLGRNLINGVFTNYTTTDISTSDATAAADKILEGYTAYINGTKVTGTFKPAANLIKKDSVVAGVTGTFTADATATSSEHIRAGYTAYANGVKISGSYAGLDTSDATATSGEHIRAGYTAYSKGVKITGTYSGIDTSDANATAAQIQSGRTAYVNGTKITGTMAPAANTIKYGTTIAGVAGTLLQTATTATAANILSGKTAYNNSGTLLTGTALGTATTATAANIMSGKTAYNNSGTLLTGTAFGTTTTAAAGHILSGYTAYTNTGTLLTGTIASRSESGTYSLAAGGSKTFSAGYYANSHGCSAPAGSTAKSGTITSSYDELYVSGLSSPSNIMLMLVDKDDFYEDIYEIVAISALNKATKPTYCGANVYHRSSADDYDYNVFCWEDGDGGTITWGSSYVSFVTSGDYEYIEGTWRYVVW